MTSLPGVFRSLSSPSLKGSLCGFLLRALPIIASSYFSYQRAVGWGGVSLRAFTEHHPQFRNTIESRMRGERAKNTTPPHTPYPITADPW